MRAAVFLLVFFFASPAFACAVLDAASPRVGSEGAAPAAVALTFTGHIFAEQSTLEVTDAAGKSVADGKPYGGKEKDNKAIALKLKTPLAPGDYKVAWSVLCDCGSHTPGDYTFTVRP